MTIDRTRDKVGTDHILHGPAYRLAHEDPDFLVEDDLRPARLQLALIKPERTLRNHAIHSMVVVFGSASIIPPEVAETQLNIAWARHRGGPTSEHQLLEAERWVHWARYYVEARRFSEFVSRQFQREGRRDFLVTEGMIASQDRDLFRFVETADQAVSILKNFYGGQPPDEPVHVRGHDMKGAK
ncbi:hypothetical protein DDZ14_13720 [Maritimibacter sp. 55A14]|uniref:hypothetical protein n=1 Tax=Maritimibacter sp. 55A14 TaxID=2174844 RepID=UPI000D62029F|nr:hypothetical protein [Maritimibacter sp. 55A14]PWE31240.1 hypothetical protein DDZ14_13720 [Maritimibacter sp. 55A14]